MAKSNKTVKNKDKKTPRKAATKKRNSVQEKILYGDRRNSALAPPIAAACAVTPFFGVVNRLSDDLIKKKREERKRAMLLQRSLDSGVVCTLVSAEDFELLLSSLTTVGKLLVEELHMNGRTTEADDLVQKVRNKLESIIS